MRVLTTRGGELATVFGPICDDPDCDCARGAVGLDSRYPIESVAVADRDDVSLDDLIAACVGFLRQTGWAEGFGPDATAEVATDMAAEAAEIASRYPLGTRLRPRFDFAAELWAYIEA